MLSNSVNRVVVTGMGALTPIGNDLSSFWNSLLSGKSGAAAITRFDAANFKTRIACELKDFNPEDYFERNEIKRYDPFTLYGLKAVEEALQHANAQQMDLTRVGVIWGSGNGGVSTSDSQVMEFAKGEGIPRFSPFFIPRILADIAGGVISIRWGFKGPNFSTIAACASATTAIIEAFNLIRLGKADAFVCGGSDAPITHSTLGGFGALKALSTRNDSPTEASRPFDRDRDGFVMGEGAAALVVESLEHALKRNAPVIAEIAGGGLASDAYHLTGTHPEGDGAVLAMTEALREAGIHPSELDHLNVHATSTPLGDKSEWEAIKRVFGDSQRLKISATKSMTGHLLGAAGAIEAVVAACSVKHDLVPFTINLENPDVKTENIEIVKNTPLPIKVDYAMSNTFGFGGHIASILFKKFEE